MRTKLTLTDLDDQLLEMLPARETLFFGNSNWAAVQATNSSLAVNAATILSEANSAAVQEIEVNQD